MSQLLALFVKSIRKIVKRLQDIQKEAITQTLPSGGEQDVELQVDPELAKKSISAEMQEIAQEVSNQLNKKQKEMIQSIDTSRYVPT